MLKAYPEAIEWFEKAIGKTRVQHCIELFRKIPVDQANYHLLNDHHSIGELVEFFNKRIISDQQQQKALRDLSISVDYRWMTERLGVKHFETREKLGDKYNIDPVRVYAINVGLAIKLNQLQAWRVE